MKALFIIQQVFCCLLLGISSLSAQVKPAEVQEKVTIKLLTGDTIVGKVAGIKDDSINFATEFGVIRVPIEQIPADTLKKLNISPQVGEDLLRARIQELEAVVASLREENANLRKEQATRAQTTPQVAPMAPAGQVAPKLAAPAEAGLSYKLSNSGKRHNSRCRYFNSDGRACTATDGVACKICGG